MDWIEFIQQYGVIGVIFAFFIDRFFAWLPKIKAFNGNGSGYKNGKTQQDIDIALIQQDLANIKSNHLKHIEGWMEKHDAEHEKDRELMIKIAYQIGVKKIESGS